MPTTNCGEPWSEKCCMAGEPERTSVRSAWGMASSVTDSDVWYHWPLRSSTDSEPGSVSSEPSNWVVSGLDERSDDRMSEAFTYAWRRMAVWRSFKMTWRAVR